MGEHEHGVTLINRLRPAPLESLGSLLERLRVANHYQERGWLGGVLGRHPARPEVRRRVADVQTLEGVTGLDRATLIGLTLHRFAPWYGVDRWLGRPLPAEVDYLPVPLWPDIGAQGTGGRGCKGRRLPRCTRRSWRHGGCGATGRRAGGGYRSPGTGPGR